MLGVVVVVFFYRSQNYLMYKILFFIDERIIATRQTLGSVWNAKLTYIQIFIPIFKYLDLGTNHLYLSSNHLYLASNHLYLGTNDLKIGTNDLYLGSNDLYLSSNTTICT